ncbi:hypothetical protein FHL15_006751 [Xylaria flabelliformis]|uniref:Uncharacterized protein n=1 Tax=Xylaria flabelliformis TaxID=2512241 RepID=A0A553HWN5_9PEZI|nr:hypothetical protein FHL15_006751 [Xylaria flabelliformis]
MAESSSPKRVKNNHPRYRQLEISRAAPYEAIEYGLEEDVLGEAKDLLDEIHEVVLDWSDFGLHDVAFEKALNYACTWGFVTGYKSVFDARIGIFCHNDKPELAVFLSFMVADTVDTSKPKDGGSSAGTARSTEKNAGQGRVGVAETLQHDKRKGDMGMPESVKRWVAKRIFDLMLRCYGSVRFPNSVCFMEDWVGSSPPGLLLGFRSTTSDLNRRAEELRACIIEQISIFAAPAVTLPINPKRMSNKR